MKWFVQYDGSTGEINAVVGGTRAPEVADQLIFDDYPVIAGKIVDLETKTLVDIPS